MLTFRELDPLFRALADPTRRWLFEELCVSVEETVSDLTEPLPMSRQAVLQHLAVLEKSGLIRTEKRDRVRWCRIEPRALDLLEEWLRRHRAYFQRRFAGARALPRVADPEIAQILRAPLRSSK
jgi:DNA-binding transcriptional ArsR family regulator